MGGTPASPVPPHAMPRTTDINSSTRGAAELSSGLCWRTPTRVAGESWLDSEPPISKIWRKRGQPFGRPRTLFANGRSSRPRAVVTCEGGFAGFCGDQRGILGWSRSACRAGKPNTRGRSIRGRAIECPCSVSIAVGFGAHWEKNEKVGRGCSAKATTKSAARLGISQRWRDACVVG